ncbi:MAG: EscU/YscU/HrcU family type III secretion system export apparatus switch protein [Kineosporiaceae bacterium]|nr:EscU/YscU/HrcU family type III secretion system export apparatus switch protein [Kineosporiaceae bacterium]
MADDEGKTEKPTAKKLKDARKQGQFPRTADAPTWLGIAGGAALLPYTVSALTEQFRLLIGHLARTAAEPTPEQALDAVADLPLAVLMAATPLCLAAAAGAILGAAVQGVHPSGQVLKPKFNRMSPKQGLKRMFGTKALWEAGKAVAKVAVIAGVVYSLARTLLPELLVAGALPLSVVVQRTTSGMITLLWATVVTGLILALFDYGYMRHTVMKQLRMSPHEIKQEMKQSEGDPLIKSQIRSRQMAMSRNRMLSAVTEADVVLVNPTHYAIALSYQPHRGAPRVVARGAGSLALKIREIARESRVPVVEDKPLTRLLYRVCDLGDEIPAELYLAVARILAFVMAAGKPSRTAGARRPTHSQPLPELPSRGQLRARRARQDRADRAAV